MRKKFSGDTSEMYWNMLNELEHISKSAKVTKQDDGILLSFDIENKSEQFNEINEDGRRLWLRKYIEDVFLKYLQEGLMFKQMDYVKENLTDVHSDNEFKVLEMILNESMKGAYGRESKCFWIIGE